MGDAFGIFISQPGVSVHDAKPGQVVLDTSHPFIKIDTQNTAGLQTITMLITNDPPEPVSPAKHRYTTIYSYKHNYAYVPAVESLINVVTPPPGMPNFNPYFMDIALIASQSFDDGATFYVVADKTNIYFIIDKYNEQSGLGSPNLLTGTNLTVTVHCFVEDIGA